MSKERLAEAVGWYGAIAVLLAYALLTGDAFTSDAAAYQGLNVTGALALAYLAFYKTAWPAVALNLIWAAIGVTGLVA